MALYCDVQYTPLNTNIVAGPHRMEMAPEAFLQPSQPSVTNQSGHLDSHQMGIVFN